MNLTWPSMDSSKSKIAVFALSVCLGLKDVRPSRSDTYITNCVSSNDFITKMLVFRYPYIYIWSSCTFLYLSQMVGHNQFSTIVSALNIKRKFCVIHSTAVTNWTTIFSQHMIRCLIYRRWQLWIVTLQHYLIND